MRRAYFWAITASLAFSVMAAPVRTFAATLNSADRARMAMLVYQSQAARQADLRRGDAITRELRSKAAAAEKLAAATRANLAQARLSSKRQVRLLEQKLDEQERGLAEAAEKYTAELAKRDDEYARERTILTSTGERLLKTSEGRRVLDLYNAGGEANWKEAKAILEEAQLVRRALDARDAAQLYMQAKGKGLETTRAVLAKYEEVVRVDPSQTNDWLMIAGLRRELGRHDEAIKALDRAEAVAKSLGERWAIAIDRAKAIDLTRGPDDAVPFAEAAIVIAREIIKGKHVKADHERLVRSLSLAADLNLRAAFGHDSHPGFERVKAVAKEAELHAMNTPTGHGFNQPGLLVDIMLTLGEVLSLHDRDALAAERQYDAAITQARKNVETRPHSAVDRRKLASALGAKARARLRDSRVDGVDGLLREVIEISKRLRESDPESVHYAVDLANDYLLLGQVLKAQSQPEKAEASLQAGLEVTGSLKANSPTLLSSILHQKLMAELGYMYLSAGRPADAIKWFDQALLLAEKQRQSFENSATNELFRRSNYDIVALRTAKGEAHWRNGNPSAAINSFTEAIEQFEKQATTGLSEDQMISFTAALNLRARAYLDQNDHDRMDADLKKSLNVIADYLRSAPNASKIASRRAGTNLDWGIILHELGRYEESRSRVTEAFVEFTKLKASFPNSMDINTGHALAMYYLADLGTDHSISTFVTWREVADLVETLHKGKLLNPLNLKELLQAREFAAAKR